MKRFISIPQVEFFSIGEELDTIDLVLYDYIFYLYGADWVDRREVDGELYIWVSYSKVLKDNPQLHIKSKRTIAKKIQNLGKKGLLKLLVDKEAGNKTYINIPPKMYEYFMVGGMSSVSPLCTDECIPLCTGECNNKYIKDNIYKRGNATRSANASRVDEPPLPASPNGSQDKGYKVEDNTDTHKINSKRFSHEDDKSIDHTSNRSNTAKPDSLNRYSRFIEEFKRYRREIKKPIKTDRPIKLFVRELEKIEAEGYDLDDALALMMEREWQTLKLDYIKGKLNKKEDEGWRWW